MKIQEAVVKLREAVDSIQAEDKKAEYQLALKAINDFFSRPRRKPGFDPSKAKRENNNVRKDKRPVKKFNSDRVVPSKEKVLRSLEEKPFVPIKTVVDRIGDAAIYKTIESLHGVVRYTIESPDQEPKVVNSLREAREALGREYAVGSKKK